MNTIKKNILIMLFCSTVSWCISMNNEGQTLQSLVHIFGLSENQKKYIVALKELETLPVSLESYNFMQKVTNYLDHIEEINQKNDL